MIHSPALDRLDFWLVFLYDFQDAVKTSPRPHFSAHLSPPLLQLNHLECAMGFDLLLEHLVEVIQRHDFLIFNLLDANGFLVSILDDVHDLGG